MNIECILVILQFMLIEFISAVPKYSFVASPDFIQERENITFFWNVQNPSTKDYISVWSPGFPSLNILITRNLYTEKFQLIGSGNTTFDLLNMRQHYQFRYHEYLTKKIYYSNLVQVDPDYPLQGHLSLTNKSDEMRLMWVSNATSNSMVKFGTRPGVYDHEISGDSWTYTVDDLCWDTKDGENSKNRWWLPGYIHSVKMINLLQQTRYYYIYGDGIKMSVEKSFISPRQHPDVSLPSKTMKMIILGDSGVSKCDEMFTVDNHLYTNLCEPNSKQTYLRIADEVHSPTSDNDTVDLIVHLGDISYAMGNSFRWDQFFNEISSFTHEVPMLTVIGNHEHNWEKQPFKWRDVYDGHTSLGECGVPYENRFIMPGVERETKTRHYWSSDSYLVHSLSISTEDDFLPGSDQYNFIVEDLRSVNRTKTPWVFVYGHRPMYCASGTTYDWMINFRFYIEPILMINRVNLVFWAHVHNYQRTCPIFSNICLGDNNNPLAPIHIVAGMSGMTISEFDLEIDHNIWQVTESEYGYLKLMIDLDELRLQFIESSNGTIKDDVKIRRIFNQIPHESTSPYLRINILVSIAVLVLTIISL